MKKSTCRVEDLLIWQGRKSQVKIVPRLFHEEFETHSSLIRFYKQKCLEIKQEGGTENTRAMGINDRPSCSVALRLSHRDTGDSQLNPRSLQRVRVVPGHKAPTVGITSWLIWIGHIGSFYIRMQLKATTLNLVYLISDKLMAACGKRSYLVAVYNYKVWIDFTPCSKKLISTWQISQFKYANLRRPVIDHNIPA